MPIPDFKIHQYLEKLHIKADTDSKSWYKRLTPLEVEEDLTYIQPPPKFTIPTFRLDQKVCFLLGIAYPQTMIMTDLGLGKTGVSLELLSYFYNIGYIRRAFIFTPTNEVGEGWEDEIKKWGFSIPYIRLKGSLSEAKWKQLETFDTGLIIGTFAGIAAMVATLEEVTKNGKPTGSKKRQIKGELIDKLVKDCDAVVFDQSTKLGNNKSLQFKVCNHFSRIAQIRYSLAGRAFGRDPFVLWSQLYVTDRGEALGDNVWMFRSAFWRPEKHSFGTTWQIRKRRLKDLSRFITMSSIQYEVSECVDLPPKSYIRKECEFLDENWIYYRRVRDELLESKGNWRECQNAFLRLRQISSGYVGFIDDTNDERAEIEFAVNPKLDLLLNLIEQVPHNAKMIIFHEFNYSGARISDELTKRGYRHGRLWGGTKDWTDIKTAFNTDPDYRILVANHKKGAMGLNLQTASYTFFYESPVSAIDRYECEGRTFRTGQSQKTFFYDLLLHGSVDEAILEFHRQGKDLHQALKTDPDLII